MYHSNVQYVSCNMCIIPSWGHLNVLTGFEPIERVAVEINGESELPLS